jgi:cell division control protein 24
MRELHIQKVLPPDTIHYLFGNLNALVDFQRRFLIQLEEIAEKQPEEQRFGALFAQNEEAFSVYEPYCSNYYSAQDLVVQETPKLQKLGHILNPTYQLPSMLIKPIQRICKYPLLQGELIKSTNKDWPHVTEMEEGLEAIKRVTEKVNETQRQHENIQAVEDLKKRVDDWKVGSNLKKRRYINLIDVILFSTGNQHRWLWQPVASRKGDHDK